MNTTTNGRATLTLEWNAAAYLTGSTDLPIAARRMTAGEMAGLEAHVRREVEQFIAGAIREHAPRLSLARVTVINLQERL